MPAGRPIESQIPSASALRAELTRPACYWDSFHAPLSSSRAGVVDLFFAVFGHHPKWMQAAIRTRNRAFRLLGLHVPDESDDFGSERQSVYAVGDTIGRWPIYTLTDCELIAGRDNSHLDFRVSVLRLPLHQPPTVAISTVCVVHNWFGKVYLFFVLPFHRAGLRYIISRAMLAGRL